MSGETIVVGAYNHKVNNLAGAGAAYVLKRAGVDESWTQVDQVCAKDPGADRCGYAVATSEGVIAVGCPFAEIAGAPPLS